MCAGVDGPCEGVGTSSGCYGIRLAFVVVCVCVSVVWGRQLGFGWGGVQVRQWQGRRNEKAQPEKKELRRKGWEEEEEGASWVV